MNVGVCWLVIVGFLCAMTGAEPGDHPPTRIMCIGDSITAGGKTFRVYQEPLLNKLSAAGYRVIFVGSQVSKTSSGELKHEGYGSHSAEMIAPKVIAAFAQTPADVVLIHAGHNHFVEEKPVNGIIRAISEMVDSFRKTNPKVKVLLAKVILSGKLPKYSYIPDLNLEIEKLCQTLNTPDSPVRCVDQTDGWNWRTDTIADLVHPNEQGAEKMANRWFAALVELIGKKVTP